MPGPEWTHYARQQIRWVDSLLYRAEGLDGPSSSTLYAETALTLENLSNLIRLLNDVDQDGRDHVAWPTPQ